MTEWYAVEDPKGRYCRFEETKDGTYRLEPVKVPEHVKREREERIKQRERRNAAEKNLMRQRALDRRSIIFLSFAMAAAVLTSCVYLYMMMAVDRQMETVTSLTEELEEAIETNDMYEARILAEENINETFALAAGELGMSSVSGDQIEYYSVDGQDYMLQYEDIE